MESRAPSRRQDHNKSARCGISQDLRHSAMNRLGESQEVADVIEWLLSARSSFVNGAAIPIDGGPTTRLY